MTPHRISVRKRITADLLRWLDYDGVAFFQMCFDTYGTMNCCWRDGPVPHPVHFREGMTVRNWIRRWLATNTEVPSVDALLLDDHWLDDHWEVMVLDAIRLCHEPEVWEELTQ